MLLIDLWGRKPVFSLSLTFTGVALIVSAFIEVFLTSILYSSTINEAFSYSKNNHFAVFNLPFDLLFISEPVLQERPDLCCEEHNFCLFWNCFHLHCRASANLCQVAEKEEILCSSITAMGKTWSILKSRFITHIWQEFRDWIVLTHGKVKPLVGFDCNMGACSRFTLDCSFS